MNDDQKRHVEALIARAVDAGNADQALKFSQAACNVAHALNTLRYMPDPAKDPKDDLAPVG